MSCPFCSYRYTPPRTQIPFPCTSASATVRRPAARIRPTVCRDIAIRRAALSWLKPSISISRIVSSSSTRKSRSDDSPSGHPAGRKRVTGGISVRLLNRFGLAMCALRAYAHNKVTQSWIIVNRCRTKNAAAAENHRPFSDRSLRRPLSHSNRQQLENRIALAFQVGGPHEERKHDHESIQHVAQHSPHGGVRIYVEKPSVRER